MGFGERFLVYPDLFPTRRSGESWGSEDLAVDFVGGPYLFRRLAPSQALAARQRFGDLVLPVSEVDPDAAIHTDLFRVGAGEFRAVDLAGWQYTFDRDPAPDSVRLAGLDFMGRIDWSPGLAGSLWTAVADGAAFQCQLENYFRLLVAYCLLDLGGVLLHSAGVVSGGRGYVFFGHSGAGKTTLSRLSQASGRRVLSDDINALCPHGDGVLVEKLPFAGDLGRTPGPRAAYPLGGLCHLRQGADALRPLGVADAVARLLACAPFVNGDPHRLDRLTDNLEYLVRRFSAAELTFSLEGDFWPLLEGRGGAGA